MGKVDFLPPNLFEAGQVKGLNAFRLELQPIDFAGANVEQYRWGGKIQWRDYLYFLIRGGLIFNQTDAADRDFHENRGIEKIGFLYSDGELSLGMKDGSVTVFTERVQGDMPTVCAWPGAYLLERYLRDKGTSLTKLTKLGKWFVEISTLYGQGKEFNAGVFLWQGLQQELRIAAAGGRLEELWFNYDWQKPDFALDFGIRID